MSNVPLLTMPPPVCISQVPPSQFALPLARIVSSRWRSVFVDAVLTLSVPPALRLSAATPLIVPAFQSSSPLTASDPLAVSGPHSATFTVYVARDGADTGRERAPGYVSVCVACVAG